MPASIDRALVSRRLIRVSCRFMMNVAALSLPSKSVRAAYPTPTAHEALLCGRQHAGPVVLYPFPAHRMTGLMSPGEREQ